MLKSEPSLRFILHDFFSFQTVARSAYTQSCLGVCVKVNLPRNYQGLKRLVKNKCRISSCPDKQKLMYTLIGIVILETPASSEINAQTQHFAWCTTWTIRSKQSEGHATREELFIALS